jgi:hypothetical protein
MRGLRGPAAQATASPMPSPPPEEADSMTGITTLTRRELEAKITARAATDPAFRAEFLADPRAAFMKFAGVDPANLPKIQVHEEGPASWHIVLPSMPAVAGELSEDELEKIAGGVAPAVSAAVFSATVAVPIVVAVISW